jgi:hypothetical protein
VGWAIPRCATAISAMAGQLHPKKFSLNNCHLIDFVLNKTIFSRRGLQAFV